MRKDKTFFNIRMDDDNDNRVENVLGYLVDLPFGYTGVVHRPHGYEKGDKAYWIVSEFMTGCAVVIGDPGVTRAEVVEEARHMFCRVGIASVEIGVKTLLCGHGLPEVN